MAWAPHVRVLIVEDHVGLAANLQEFFDERRYALDFAYDGLSALHLIATRDFDVIVLDVMLPGLSGFEICRRIRNDLQRATPVILMTARDQLHDKEEGFAAGADDYLVKPFELRELQWRVDALYRRRGGFAVSPVVRVDTVVFDPDTQTVRLDGGQQLDLAGTAARIFEVIIKAYPGFVSYEQILDRVWGGRETDMNTLRTHVYGLRKSLQDALGHPMIRTLHGRGYRFLPPGND